MLLSISNLIQVHRERRAVTEAAAEEVERERREHAATRLRADAAAARAKVGLVPHSTFSGSW